MPDVLLCCYGGGHVRMLLPVAQRLIAAGVGIEFLALTTAQPVLAAAGIPFIGYADLPDASNPKVIEFGERLAADLSSGLVSHEETVAYLGTNYCEMVENIGAEAAEQRYLAEGRQCFKPVRIMLRLLSQNRPRLVITTNSPRSERALLEAARYMGLPSVALVDLFGGREMEWLQPVPKICVLDEKVRQKFLRAGYDDAQVVATGNPAFDDINSPEQITAGALWRASHDCGEKLILWAPQPDEIDLHLLIEAELRKTVARNRGWHLLVRHHPNSTQGFEPQDRVMLSSSSEALHPLLHASDVVVVTASTVGLEAYLAGRPVVAVESSVSRQVPYARMGIAHGSTIDNLEATIRAVAPSVAKAGATAAEQVVQEVLRLLRPQAIVGRV